MADVGGSQGGTAHGVRMGCDPSPHNGRSAACLPSELAECSNAPPPPAPPAKPATTSRMPAVRCMFALAVLLLAAGAAARGGARQGAGLGGAAVPAVSGATHHHGSPVVILPTDPKVDPKIAGKPCV